MLYAAVDSQKLLKWHFSRSPSTLKRPKAAKRASSENGASLASLGVAFQIRELPTVVSKKLSSFASVCAQEWEEDNDNDPEAVKMLNEMWKNEVQTIMLRQSVG